MADFFTKHEITKYDFENLTNKLERFVQYTNTRKSVMLTMITSFGVKPGKYSGMVQRQVTLEHLYDKLR